MHNSASTTSNVKSLKRPSVSLSCKLPSDSGEPKEYPYQNKKISRASFNENGCFRGLLSFVELAISSALQSGKSAAAKAYAKTLKPLTQYIASLQTPDRDADIFSLLDPAFIKGFRLYLIGAYTATLPGATISDATVTRHLNNLRLITRAAITAYGALPNLRPGTDQPEVKKLAFDYHSEFARLVYLFAKADDRTGNSPSNKEASFQALQTRLLGHLLLSVLTAGNPHQAPTEATPDLPGATLIHTLAVRFGTASLTETQIESTIKLLDLHNLSHRWLLYPRAAWQSLKGGALVAQPSLSDLNAVASPYTSIISSWYAVKTINGSATELAKIITADRLLPQQAIYVPRQEIVKETNGRRTKINNPVIDRIFFIHTTQRQADAFQRAIRTQGIIYGNTTDTGSRYYTVIPDRQLTSFRRFLGVPDTELITLDPTLHYPGARVRITGGPFIGCEGVISEIKMSHASASHFPKGEAAADGSMAETAEPRTVKCFVIKIEGLCAFGTLDIDPSLLEYQGGLDSQGRGAASSH